MSQGHLLFTVGESPVCNKNAKNLAHAFYPNENTKIIDLSDDDCFADINQSGIRKIVFLAHGSVSTFGGHPAEKFAEIFNERFMKSCAKISKSDVNDIYLIGCDIGFISEDAKTSVSQDIANELFDHGFHNVRIHSVAKPDNAIGDVLYVEVLNCSGSAGLVAYATALANKDNGSSRDVQTGYLKAYLLCQHDAERLAELEKNSVKNGRAIAEIKRQKAYILINHANPETELNKPHNTFYPNESVLQRNNRILKDTSRQYSKHQTEAIALLGNQRDYLAQKSVIKEKMMATRLDFLIVQVQIANEKHWPKVVGEYARYLHQNPVYASFFNNESNTYKLLDALSKSDFKAANAIVVAHGNKKQTRVQNPTSTFLTARRNVERIPAFASALPQVPEALLKKINQLALELRREIKEMRSGCFSIFYKYEINTKLAKLAVMNALMNCKTLSEAKLIANDAIKQSRVMRSMRHTRTKDILMEMIANKTSEQYLSEFGTIAPTAKK